MSDKVDFDEFTENYDELLSQQTQFFSPSDLYFAEYKIKLVKRKVKHNVSTILEYGCGTGRNLGFLQENFPDAQIIATDISQSSLELASETNPKIEFRVETSDLDIGPFDLIFISGVFHHIPKAERKVAAGLLAKRLSKGGTLFIFEHNPYNPITRKIVNDCPYDADAELLKASELRQVFTLTALQVESLSYNLFIPPKLRWLLPAEKMLQWLPMGGQYCMAFRHS